MKFISKKTIRVFDAWKNGTCIGFDRIRTGGQRILAFRTPILTRLNGSVILNVSQVRGKNARVIARRQREVATLLRKSGITFRNSVSGICS